VGNGDRRSYVCMAFVLASALSLLAQSDRTDFNRQNGFQVKGDTAQGLLAANLGEFPAIGSASNESELPDAPSSTKSDGSITDSSGSPAVKRESSHGAPPAATGGPFWVDRSVVDRNYVLVTGGMIGSSILNTEFTMSCFAKHPSCNDIPSFFHRRLVLYGIGLPADLGVAYLTYYMKKKHNHLWFVPAAVVTGANVVLGVRAYRWANQ
jgi:hypothetical protein